MTAVLAGCSSPAVPEQDFEGPWAAEFAQHYSEASDDFMRGVLEDGTITEGELAETIERFDGCLQASGITMSDYDGGFEITEPPGMSHDQSHEIVTGCSRTSGEDLIGSLYYWVARNPHHEDENELMIACMIDAGLVERGYRVDDYLSDMSSGGELPLLDQSPKGRELQIACERDPLGLTLDEE